MVLMNTITRGRAYMYLVGNLIEASHIAKYTTVQSRVMSFIVALFQSEGKKSKMSIKKTIAWRTAIHYVNSMQGRKLNAGP